ncbi:hypothetical protein DOT_5398 [Desulfosporosinus sp. OT]|nr:hypothetical protein DOT_5398 [Desulfosporosinus sp. OT]
METTHLHSLLNVQMSIHGQRINATKAWRLHQDLAKAPAKFSYPYKV